MYFNLLGNDSWLLSRLLPCFVGTDDRWSGDDESCWIWNCVVGKRVERLTNSDGWICIWGWAAGKWVGDGCVCIWGWVAGEMVGGLTSFYGCIWHWACSCMGAVGLSGSNDSDWFWHCVGGGWSWAVRPDKNLLQSWNYLQMNALLWWLIWLIHMTSLTIKFFHRNEIIKNIN